ncbi:MAG: hypothetical protein IJ351_06690, partial [Oscillospiraceae bacterium]|nr:hypothetical protein [Oscillospiraceae bacterium]
MKGKHLIRFRLFGFALCLGLLLGLAVTGSAATVLTEPAKSSNIQNHEYAYDRWAKPVSSNLVENSDGTFTRVENVGTGVAVEIYSSELQFVSGKIMDMELPIYGGYYCGSDSHFLIFGQANPNEDNNLEVIRVVRYDRNWKRTGSASLYGGNTTIPFDAGAVRCSEYGGYLYIHTAHEMYATTDGINHQANLTMNVRISDMTLTEARYQVVNRYRGYISHSFNQFIRTDGGTLVTVDHGDAYPRSVVLMRYFAPAGQDSFTEEKQVVISSTSGSLTYRWQAVEYVDVLSIAGESGSNDTGVSLGGFEVSDTAYLIAGNTVSQGEDYDPAGQRNIFVSATAKDNFTVAGTKINYLTNYTADAAVEVGNPQFVKVNANKYAVLWMENRSLRCAFVDGNGNLLGDIVTAGGVVSDCVPIVSGNRLIWYVTSNSGPAFMVMDLDDPAGLTHQHVNTYEYTSYPGYSSPGSLCSVCAVCGEAGESVVIPAIGGSDEYVLSKVTTEATCETDGYGYFSWIYLPNYDVTQYIFGAKIDATGHDYTAVTTPGSCTVDAVTTYTCGNCGGTYTEIHAAAGHQYDTQPEVPPTCTEPGSGTVTCTVCGETFSGEIPATGHSYETETREVTCTEAGGVYHTCVSCGDFYITDEVAPNGHVYGMTSSMLPGCLRSGYKKSYCDNCDYVKTETLPPTGHSYSAVVTAPTCTDGGYTTYTCSLCGDSYTGNEVAASGHSYSGGSCTVCGAADPDYNPVTVPTLTAKNISLSFEDEILVNVYFTAADTADVENYGLLLFSEKVATPTFDTAIAYTEGWYESNGYLGVTTPGIAAKNMGDTLYFAVYAVLSDGSYAYTKTYSYAPTTYAYNMLGKTSTSAG